MQNIYYYSSLHFKRKFLSVLVILIVFDAEAQIEHISINENIHLEKIHVGVDTRLNLITDSLHHFRIASLRIGGAIKHKISKALEFDLLGGLQINS